MVNLVPDRQLYEWDTQSLADPPHAPEILRASLFKAVHAIRELQTSLTSSPWIVRPVDADGNALPWPDNKLPSIGSLVVYYTMHDEDLPFIGRYTGSNMNLVTQFFVVLPFEPASVDADEGGVIEC